MRTWLSTLGKIIATGVAIATVALGLILVATRLTAGVWAVDEYWVIGAMVLLLLAAGGGLTGSTSLDVHPGQVAREVQNDFRDRALARNSTYSFAVAALLLFLFLYVGA